MDSDTRRLVVSGKLIDTITSKSVPVPDCTAFLRKPKSESMPKHPVDPEYSSIVQSQGVASFAALREWAYLVNSLRSYPSARSVVEAFSQTLFEEWGAITPPRNIISLENFATWMVIILGDSLDGFDIDFKHIPTSMDAALRDPSFLTIHAAILMHAHSKSLFLTEAGQMGTAPQLFECGDVVALISGMKMPLILRPTSGPEYTVVCPAYIHGIMHGEVWNSGKIETQVLELR